MAFLHDVLMAGSSFLAALWLRFGDLSSVSDDLLFTGFLLFVTLAIIVFSSLRLYRGIWRYASVPDLIALARAATFLLLAFTACLFLVSRLEGYPRSALLINWLLLMMFLGMPRLAYRIFKDKSFHLDFYRRDKDKRVPVLLIGLGYQAELFLRETARSRDSLYRVVGIIDPEKISKGGTIQGVPVLGGIESLDEALSLLNERGEQPHRFVLAHDDFSGDEVRSFIDLATKEGISVAKLPSRQTLLNAGEIVEVRPIAIEDVLGRAPKRPALGRRKYLLEGKRILVTGAGGTIGGELCRQILPFAPSALAIIEHSEFHLYRIEQELKALAPEVFLRPFIANIRDKERVAEIWENYKPDIVFHAAALKHVPLVEENPIEAILTNVFGTKNIADACAEFETTQMVLISTDKAVYPSSIMGSTKRLAERILSFYNRSRKESGCLFTAVRFGNVLGSSGSVIPLFQNQIAKGGPVTVTHPEMTRYFMTVGEAAELVLQASALASSSKSPALFVLEMGEPVSIKDLAHQMIRLAGLEPDKDIEVVFTGLRAGEKLTEVLSYPDENLSMTDCPGILCTKNFSENNADFSEMLAQLYSICREQNEGEALSLLKKLVPEYSIFSENNN